MESVTVVPSWHQSCKTHPGVYGHETRRRNSHGGLHLVERLRSLVEEPEDDALAELPLIVIIIHLQDLLEGSRVDAVAKVHRVVVVALYSQASVSHNSVGLSFRRTQRLGRNVADEGGVGGMVGRGKAEVYTLT